MEIPNKKLTTERSNGTQYRSNRMYALTVHDNISRWPSPLEYERFLNELEKIPGFKLIEYKYEVGKLTKKNSQSGKLHLHGVVLAPSPLPYMKHAITLKGYRYELRPLYSRTGWNDYIKEDIEEYMISHFWDMDKLEYDIVSQYRKDKGILSTS